ncbi:MAG: hypothetical protein R6X29_10390 [Acidimicrobiia bacterium]
MPAPLDPICLFAVLAEHRVEYVLVGGMAAVLHGSPTFTGDADIVPSPTPDNLVRLSAALSDLNARIRSLADPDGIAFDPHPELLASMAMLNLTTRCGDLDLTFTPAGTGGYDDVVEGAIVFDVDGTRVPVASLDDVIHSKRMADRPKDRAVLPVLEALRDEIRRLEN